MKRNYEINKKKSFLIVIFVFLISISMNNRVTYGEEDFSIGVEESMEFLYEIVDFEEDEVKILSERLGDFMPYYGDSEGERSKVRITKIEENEERYKIEYFFWDYIESEDDFDNEPDKRNKKTKCPLDPDDIYLVYNGDHPPKLVLLETKKYIQKIECYSGSLGFHSVDRNSTFDLVVINEEESSLKEFDYSSDKNSIFLSYSDPGYESPYGSSEPYSYQAEWEYDKETGWLSGYKIVDKKNDKTIYKLEITTYELISGYDIQIMITISISILIGCVYIVKRRINQKIDHKSC